MAQKRMFDKSITNDDSFLEMSIGSQVLYFHLSMNADDDGFVNNWKSIMKMVGAKEDDLKVLIAKSYVIPFETGVIVIKHWKINNYLRNDRYKPTRFQKEYQQLTTDNDLVYQLDTNGIPSIDKYRIDKNSIDKYSIKEKEEEKENIYDYIQKNFSRTLAPLEIETIDTWEDNELTRYAIKQAVINGKYNIRYIDKILYNYKMQNIKSVQQAQNQEQNFNKRKQPYIETTEWLNKDLKSESMSNEEQEEFNNILDDIMENIDNIGE